MKQFLFDLMIVNLDCAAATCQMREKSFFSGIFYFSKHKEMPFRSFSFLLIVAVLFTGKKTQLPFIIMLIDEKPLGNAIPLLSKRLKPPATLDMRWGFW